MKKDKATLHCPDDFRSQIQFAVCGLMPSSMSGTLFASAKKKVTCKNCLRVLASQARKKEAAREKRARRVRRQKQKKRKG